MGPREVDEAADDAEEMPVSGAGEAGGGRVKNGGRVRASTWFEQELTIAAIMAIANTRKTGTLCAIFEGWTNAVLPWPAIRFLLTADAPSVSFSNSAAAVVHVACVSADRRASAKDGNEHADADDADTCICR